jgi:hypothetical protein
MSNYYYNDQLLYAQQGKYPSLYDTRSLECNQECISRSTRERSNRDRMDHAYYVMGHTPSLSPLTNNLWLSQGYRENKYF